MPAKSLTGKGNGIASQKPTLASQIKFQSTNGLVDLQTQINALSVDSHPTVESLARYTPFNEQYFVQKKAIFSLNSAWGISRLRNDIVTTGSGAVSENNGEIVVSTGTTASSSVKLQSIERGQYIAGAEAEVGVGIRIPTLPTGSQNAMWGYFDDENGFGFGVDSTDFYTFIRRNGTTTKTYREDWNIDPLDGTGESELNNALQIIVWQIDFTWYGYGKISYIANVANTNEQQRFQLHSFIPSDQNSIVDPNQPITVVVENGETTSDFSIRVGGRQFSIASQEVRLGHRPVSEMIETIAISSTSYIPVIAMRKKLTFGESSRANSINIVFDRFKLTTDSDVFFQLSYADTDLDGTWADPSGWGDESAAEINTSLTTGTVGLPLFRGRLPAAKNNDEILLLQERILVGNEKPIVLWLKVPSGTANVSVVLNWSEEW